VWFDISAFIDLVDERGKLAEVHSLKPLASVREAFEDRLTYIPVMLESKDVLFYCHYFVVHFDMLKHCFVVVFAVCIDFFDI